MGYENLVCPHRGIKNLLGNACATQYLIECVLLCQTNCYYMIRFDTSFNSFFMGLFSLCFTIVVVMCYCCWHLLYIAKNYTRLAFCVRSIVRMFKFYQRLDLTKALTIQLIPKAHWCNFPGNLVRAKWDYRPRSDSRRAQLQFRPFSLK